MGAVANGAPWQRTATVGIQELPGAAVTEPNMTPVRLEEPELGSFCFHHLTAGSLSFVELAPGRLDTDHTLVSPIVDWATKRRIEVSSGSGEASRCWLFLRAVAIMTGQQKHAAKVWFSKPDESRTASSLLGLEAVLLLRLRQAV